MFTFTAVLHVLEVGEKSEYALGLVEVAHLETLSNKQISFADSKLAPSVILSENYSCEDKRRASEQSG